MLISSKANTSSLHRRDKLYKIHSIPMFLLALAPNVAGTETVAFASKIENQQAQRTSKWSGMELNGENKRLIGSSFVGIGRHLIKGTSSIRHQAQRIATSAVRGGRCGY
ncbi:hypothetical protein ACLKA7_012246 [Drosophila subpalustris]